MPGLERIVPEEKRFDTVTSEYGDLLYEYFQDLQQDTGDILDPNYEMKFLTKEWDHFFFVMSQALASEHDNLQDTYHATYRGFVFGAQLANLISDAPANAFSLRRYLSVTSSENFGEMVQTDVQEYLGKNPMLDAAIGYFTPELDPAGKSAHTIETAAGLALRMAEDDLGKSLFYAELGDYPEENPSL